VVYGALTLFWLGWAGLFGLNKINDLAALIMFCVIYAQWFLCRSAAVFVAQMPRSTATRQQALQAFAGLRAGTGSSASKIAACRAVLTVVFSPKRVCSPKITLRKKYRPSTYAFKVVI
jgi:hypothetical protein